MYGIEIDDFELGIEGEFAMVSGLSEIERFWEHDVIVCESKLDFALVDGEDATVARRFELLEKGGLVGEYLLEEIKGVIVHGRLD